MSGTSVSLNSLGPDRVAQYDRQIKVLALAAGCTLVLLVVSLLALQRMEAFGTISEGGKRSMTCAIGACLLTELLAPMMLYKFRSDIIERLGEKRPVEVQSVEKPLHLRKVSDEEAVKLQSQLTAQMTGVTSPQLVPREVTVSIYTMKRATVAGTGINIVGPSLKFFLYQEKADAPLCLAIGGPNFFNAFCNASQLAFYISQGFKEATKEELFPGELKVPGSYSSTISFEN